MTAGHAASHKSTKHNTITVQIHRTETVEIRSQKE